ncbi:uncharacterized protein [Dermacentor albipictus]|uniref:uncharacterized protein n=1 Tax=Dermacentor albipictus TaxID=60249 RepID=UPI0038FCCDA3
MSDEQRSHEHPPTGKGTPAKDDSSDEDMPSASQSRSPATPTKDDDDAPLVENTAPTSSKASSSRDEKPEGPKSTKSRGKSPLKRLGSNLISFLGKAGYPGYPLRSPRKTQFQPGSSGSKLRAGPKGDETCMDQEVGSAAEYYSRSSFFTRGLGMTKHILPDPQAAVTAPETTPRKASEPTYSTAPSSSVDGASASAQYPNLTSIAMSQSRASSSTEAAYPNLTSIAKSQSQAACSKPKLSKALPTMSSTSSSSVSGSYSQLTTSSMTTSSWTSSLTTSSSHSKVASRSTASSCLPPSSDDDDDESSSGAQSSSVRDAASSSFLPDLPEKSESPPPRTNETAEERLKRMRRKDEPRK